MPPAPLDRLVRRLRQHTEVPDAELVEIRDPNNGSFDDCLATWRDGKHGPQFVERKLEPPTAATTDAGGRFRITGIGRDRVAVLQVSGPAIQHARIFVQTHQGSSLRRRGTSTAWEPNVMQGPSFDHLATAGRVIRGVVRERGTGTLLAGIRVASTTSATPVYTDANGRYELPGNAKGPRYDLWVTPPDS